MNLNRTIHVLKISVTLAALVIVAASCDVQSGMSRKSVEKYMPSPTPEVKAAATPEPVDPAESITVAASDQGPDISVDEAAGAKTVTCGKYNRVIINTMDAKITVKGACRQLMINGDGNKITLDATTDIVINGEKNAVTYAKYVNAKRPDVKDNGSENSIEKVTAAAK